MTAERMAEIILETIKTHPHATFIELVNACGPEAEGEWAIPVPNYPKVILWSGISEKFFEALKQAQPKVTIHPTNIMVYLFDGNVIPYPVLDENSDFDHLQTEHWYPVTLTLREQHRWAVSPTAR